MVARLKRRFFVKSGLAASASLLLPTIARASNRSIELAYFHNYPPFSWDAGKGMQGLLVDLLTEALEDRMGLQVSHFGYPWKRAQNLVKVGVHDGFCTVPTQERRSYTTISQTASVKATFTLFINTDSEKKEALAAVRSLDDLREFSIGHILGSGWAQKNLVGRGLKLQQTSTLDSTLAMLARGRIDAVIDTSQVVRYRIKQLGLKDQLQELLQVLDEAPFSLCIGNSSPFR